MGAEIRCVNNRVISWGRVKAKVLLDTVKSHGGVVTPISPAGHARLWTYHTHLLTSYMCCVMPLDCEGLKPLSTTHDDDSTNTTQQNIIMGIRNHCLLVQSKRSDLINHSSKRILIARTLWLSTADGH
ncbi:conserved hypothetical protein [Coccidioides posadasii str. Silveira]|uniref:Uncharacterized protein n=1 Tax=Coccidioides posadasii (strain RMSCC 757 / Silveira) TaxID=443226 RepID=E9DCT8_COCPS|nr:conserved hypothetical protein [Coccidioides posadasii str. Silveira]